MNESFDLRGLLAGWPYDPDRDARIVRDTDGREVLQVRTPLGIEQLEMTGRPDGLRPHGMESILEFHRQRLAAATAAGDEAGFTLEADDCAELFAEGTLYYFRYVRLFQLRHWDGTVRDTTRNLALFDFVHRHAAREEDQVHLEKWRPYVLRMNAAAAASLALEQGVHQQAEELVREAIRRLEELESLDDETFTVERARSLAALRELAAQIHQVRPVSAVERLETQLRRAIDRQEFERAAELRDRLRDIKSRQPAG
jgi:hypothetical protein